MRPDSRRGSSTRGRTNLFSGRVFRRRPQPPPSLHGPSPLIRAEPGPSRQYNDQPSRSHPPKRTNNKPLGAWSVIPEKYREPQITKATETAEAEMTKEWVSHIRQHFRDLKSDLASKSQTLIRAESHLRQSPESFIGWDEFYQTVLRPLNKNLSDKVFEAIDTWLDTQETSIDNAIATLSAE